MANAAVLTENIPVAELVTAVVTARPPEFGPHCPAGKKFSSAPWFCYRQGRFLADDIHTMDWEGGTIGAIVPALMGHGEAGRASPWPFSYT